MEKSVPRTNLIFTVWVAGKWWAVDGGRMTSDGGGLLLREIDQRLGLLDRMAAWFTDYRNPNSVEHSVHSLVAQRSMA